MRPRNRPRGLFTLSVGIVAASLTLAVPVSAAAKVKPTVSSFTASPPTLYNNGGTVTLSAVVTNATSCTLSSKKPVPGMPATVACSGGTVTYSVTLPPNAGKKPVKYKFHLAVAGAKTVKAKPVKVIVSTLASPSSLTTVTAGLNGYCARLSFGGVDCWGLNNFGDLGNGTKTNSAVPVAVTGISNAVAVTANGNGASYCAVLSTGGVKCWGYSGNGELGDGNTTGPSACANGDPCSLTPVSVLGVTNAVALASTGVPNLGYLGSYCALLSGGGIDCWGWNNFGDLGTGSTGGVDCSHGCNATAHAVTGITNATAIIGYQADFGYCAVLATGGVDCWGANSYGELGSGTTIASSDVPVTVSGISDASALTSGLDSVCARRTGGGIDCWGDNGGQLGNGTTVSYSDVAVPVTGITNATSVNAPLPATHTGAGYSGSYCAVLSTGSVKCWGSDNYGVLGDNNGINGAFVPVTVTGITNATAMTSGFYGSPCARLSTGGVDCWGSNSDGELGNGMTPSTEANVGAPVEVHGVGGTGTLTGVASVSGGSDAIGFCAVLTAGGIDCWGSNTGGALGSGSTHPYSDVPVKVHLP